MKQADLAKLLNISANAISNYEVGIRELDAQTICRICDIFECSADYLLCRSDRQTPELTPEEEQLLAAWNRAPKEIRAIVDTALSPYREDAGAAVPTA